ncbi:MAG TPA: BatD family protein [Anaerolineae bacterium]|nr:BatD family protein [Anaerolineae bacterium]
MGRIRYGIILIISLVGVMLGWPVEVGAQAEPPLQASLDKTAVSLGEQLTLTVVLSGTSVRTPALPAAIDGLQFVNGQTSMQSVTINGQTNTQTVYRYIFRTVEAGTWTIPSFTAVVDGQTYATEPLTFTVSLGGVPTPAAPSSPGTVQMPLPDLNDNLAGADLFVVAEVDKENPYIGEQVMYTLHFYRASNVLLLDQPRYVAPDFSGFVVQGVTEQTNQSVVVENVPYQVTSLSTVLFPVVAGEQVIEPAGLMITGLSFTTNGMVETEPVTVNVKPLPEPQPADFSGSVGVMTLTAAVDLTTVAVNEPVTLRLTLAGVGSVDNWQDPVVPPITNWRFFEETVRSDSQIVGEVAQGERLYEQLLVPTAVGQSEIPAISYTFFNPQTEMYETVTTEAIGLNVLPGETEAPVPPAPIGGTNELAVTTSNIRHIKPAGELKLGGEVWTKRPFYWFLWVLPLLVLMVDVAWRRRAAILAANPVRRRKLGAGEQARARLAAGQAGEEEMYGAISGALLGYVSDRLDREVAGWRRGDLLELLADEGVSAELREQLRQLLEECDMGRFAPMAGEEVASSSLWGRAERLIGRFEEEWV